MKKSSIVAIMAFALVIVAYLFLRTAYLALWVLILTGTPPPFLTGTTAIPGMHDLGVGLSSIGLIILFVVAVDGLRTDPTESVSEKWQGRTRFIWASDFYYVLIFGCVFIAWIGVWLLVHFTFLYVLEGFWVGGIPQEDWLYLPLNLSWSQVHLTGMALAWLGLFTLLALVVIPKILIYRNQRRTTKGDTPQYNILEMEAES